MSKWRDTEGLSPQQMLDIPPVWLVVALVLAWAIAQGFPGLATPLPLLRVLGVFLVGSGVALMVWAVVAFRAHRTSVVPHQTPVTLITSGPFARSRNPIYLGDVLVLAGAIMWWGAWPALVLIPIFVWVLVRRFIAPEEQRMKHRFGAEFASYAEKTPRWL